jgi:hypothetical protein
MHNSLREQARQHVEDRDRQPVGRTSRGYDAGEGCERP